MIICVNQIFCKSFIVLIAISAFTEKGCWCAGPAEETYDTPDSDYSAATEGDYDIEPEMQTETPFKEYMDVTQYPGELCNRNCSNGQRRVCYFHFTLEHYQAMGVACGKCSQHRESDCNDPECIPADGVEKGVMSINRKVPGPAILVCKDDLVIVDVVNKAQGTAATIHWHGVHMVETPYMDGVPFVTQCPIMFANTFRYQFYASEPGTHFYHSHSGHHKVNGQYGALIIRRPKEPTRAFYDYDLPEHLVYISDWMHSYGEQYYPGLPSAGGIFPNSVLINGRGVYTNPKTGEQTTVRPTVYYVMPGKRYRFRLINSISHACPFKIQIENHRMTVISSDSYDVEPSTYDTVVSNAGERYDFVLEANHTEGDFWVRVRGMGVCSINPIESYALIRYKTSANSDSHEDEADLPPYPLYADQYDSGVILNHPNATCFGGDNDHCVSELTALEKDDDLRYATPDYQFFLSFSNYVVPNKEIFDTGYYNHFSNLNSNLTVVAAINNITLSFPDSPPLTQPESMKETQYCNDINRPDTCSNHRLCPCTHLLRVGLNSVVEIIIVDETQGIGRMHHPYHLHGYRFMVTGLGQHPYGIPMTVALAKQMEKSRTLPRDYFNPSPPFKDTITIPSTGYAVIRFRATNPGFWLMHCHYEWHLAIGMGLVLQVGDTTEMIKAPKGFPKCGNYIPPVQKPNF